LRILCWIIKVTNIDSEYVILTGIPRQKLLRERVSILRLYVHCLQTVKIS